MAISVGAPMAELDVHCTADGHCVVHHDATIGDLQIAHASLSTAQKAARADAYRLSTLTEILDLCRGRIALDIEIKTPGFESPLLREVAAAFSADDVVYKSFHARTVRALKALDARATVGLLVGISEEGRRVPQIAAGLFPEIRVLRCGADFVSPDHRLLKLGFIRRFHRLGIPVWPWTVNEPHRIRELMGRVDALITDRPDIALGIVP